ncbi:hypothetical protein J3R30DRAFT_3230251, partial [Lentinula aciculospora]
CKQAEEECFHEKWKKMILSSSALHRQIHRGQSHTEAKEEQHWLNNNEEAALVNGGDRGFPLDHKRLKEHADEIARARHP